MAIAAPANAVAGVLPQPTGLTGYGQVTDMVCVFHSEWQKFSYISD